MNDLQIDRIFAQYREWDGPVGPRLVGYLEYARAMVQDAHSATPPAAVGVSAAVSRTPAGVVNGALRGGRLPEKEDSWGDPSTAAPPAPAGVTTHTSRTATRANG